MKDPADPYVLDVHDFRRAGDSRRVERVVPAPAELGNPVITVPPDSQVDLDLLLESVVEGVLVDGAVRYRAVGSAAAASSRWPNSARRRCRSCTRGRPSRARTMICCL